LWSLENSVTRVDTLLFHYAFYETIFTATSLLILALLSQSTLAATIQTTECDIIGEPDVYGPGVRLGFYLQCSSILIFQFLAPSYGDMMRPASAVTALAVYINTLRNLDLNSLVTIDWPILFFLTFILLVSICQLPGQHLREQAELFSL
jgi:hypothetical protein